MSLEFEPILSRILKATGLKNREQIAESIKINSQAINNYKNKNKWPVVTLHKLSVVHGISLDWLLTGSGPMRIDREAKPWTVSESPTKYEDTLHADIYIDLNEIIEAGDREIIESLAERLKDMKASLGRKRKDDEILKRLEKLEGAMRARAAPDLTGGPDRTTAAAKSGEPDPEEKAM